MKAVKKIVKWIKDFFKEFGEHRIPRMAAALAYYTLFSLPALLLIIIWIGDIFYGQEAIEGKLFGEIAGLVGTDSAKQIEDAIWYSRVSDDASLAAVIGIITLFIGATGIFAEIQDSINRIWHIKAKPGKGKGWYRMLIKRLLSFSTIAVMGFLLLVSLMVNTAADLIGRRLASLFSTEEVVLLYVINFVFSFILIAALFAIIFKVLPDGIIPWKLIYSGVLITTILFVVGKIVLSYYISSRGSQSPYGTAGTVVIILVWVYYSAIILYSGAIITRLWVIRRGSKIQPKKYAVWVEDVEIPPTQTDGSAAP